MNNTPKLSISTAFREGKKLPKERAPRGRPSGKLTESLTIRSIQKYYGLSCLVDRLPDSLDSGKYEDIRPCDIIVTTERGRISNENTVWYIECKETRQKSVTLPFSVLNKGQLQAIKNTFRLKIPYFVVFNHMETKKIYLVPADRIISQMEDGKKSLNSKELEPFIWNELGKLYDYF